MKTELTAERLRELLSYDPETGCFWWIVVRGGMPPEKEGAAGSLRNGYIRIKVDGRMYSAHRLAWLYMLGVWPLGQIDHKNRVRSDNRWKNLREVSFGENQQNQLHATKKNKLGLLGVSTFQGRYRAQIGADGRHYYLGSFATPEEASAKYWEVKARLHKNCPAVEYANQLQPG